VKKKFRATRLDERLACPVDATGAVTLSEALASGKPFKELQISFKSATAKPAHPAQRQGAARRRRHLFRFWRGVVSDVTEKVQSAKSFASAGPHGLFDRADQPLQAPGIFDGEEVAGKHPLALLSIDLDRFKSQSTIAMATALGTMCCV